MTRIVQELRRTQSIIRLRTILGTLLLIVMMVAFGLMTFQMMRENLSQEKLQQATADRVKMLIPQLDAPIRATLNNVVPYYMEMGRERLRTLGPKMDARIKDQTDKLGTELERRINAQVEASFGRIMNRTMVELSKEFPAVAQDGGVRATERLKQAMAGETGRLVEHGRTLYDTQSARIRQSLKRFPLPDVRQNDTDALQRQLLHNLLMFADYELTASAQQRPAGAAPNAATRP
jgi:hypothetical protein